MYRYDVMMIVGAAGVLMTMARRRISQHQETVVRTVIDQVASDSVQSAWLTRTSSEASYGIVVLYYSLS